MIELNEIAKLANDKGFKPHSVSTNYTNKYLLGGKNFFINDTCIYLWLCEVQKWLRDTEGVVINVLPVDDRWYYLLTRKNETLTLNRTRKTYDVSPEDALRKGLLDAING
jgi:hypothetical protein